MNRWAPFTNDELRSIYTGLCTAFGEFKDSEFAINEIRAELKRRPQDELDAADYQRRKDALYPKA